MRLAAGANRTEPTGPALKREVEGGANAASLLAELARPPSRCFRTRHCPRRSTLDQHWFKALHGGRNSVGISTLLLYGSEMYVRALVVASGPSKV